MSMLQLQGESAQLRKVARSFAAGELTSGDYRNIRSAIIESFVAELNGDLTPTFVAADPDLTPKHVATLEHAEDESGWSLLAVLGSAALLFIVAALAIILG